MREDRGFFSREKQVFLVGFSLTIPRFPRKSENRLNTTPQEKAFLKILQEITCVGVTF